MYLATLNAVCAALISLAYMPGNVNAQERQLIPLTDDDVRKARTIEKEALLDLKRPLVERSTSSIFSLRVQSLIDEPAVRENRQMEPAVSILGAPGLIPENAARRAVVTRFDYSTGLAVTTVVDLDKNKVLSIRATPDRPVPLGADEFERVIILARNGSTEVAQLLESVGRDKIDFQVLVEMDSVPSSPQYGHRLVLFWAQAPRSTERLLVDLTSDKVIHNEAIDK